MSAEPLARPLTGVRRRGHAAIGRQRHVDAAAAAADDLRQRCAAGAGIVGVAAVHGANAVRTHTQTAGVAYRRRRVPAAEVTDDIGRRDFREVAADFQNERAVGLDGWFAPEEEIERGKADNRNEDGDSKQRGQKRESAACHIPPVVR